MIFKYDNKNCERCGKEFKLKSPRQLYCKKCKVIRDKENQHAYYEERKRKKLQTR